MLLPEFENAQYSGADPNFKKIFVGISKIAFIIVLFFSTIGLTFCLFLLIFPDINETDGFYSLSIGAALVTFLSAMISLLSLADSECMKKYENNLQLLESRYLDNKKISGWNFLMRQSCNPTGINYRVSSAYFILYASDNPTDKFKITIPALSVDLQGSHCIKEICRLKRFTPKFLDYILEKADNIFEPNYSGKISKESPIYYITLPNHIYALYKNVLEHKLIKYTTIFCILLLIAATILTVIYPFIMPIIM